MPRMIPLPDHSVYWNVWDPDRRTTDHHVARGAEIGPRGQVFRDPDVVDVPQHVVDQVEAIRQKELRNNELGRHYDPKAGAVRWVPEDEYADYVANEAEKAAPVNQFSDEQIGQWDTNTAISHVNQVPGLAERVRDLETKRSRTRKAVVAHCDRVIEAADAVSKGRDPRVGLADADDE